jgi:hypothetical protein
MALSPQYSWPEPDNSSLVKNGAQDIRALGDAIDTSVWNVGYGQAGKNKIINGNFGIWQRGTSFSPTSAAIMYTADRFFVYNNGTGVITASQQTFTPGAAPVAGYEGSFFHRIGTAASLGTTTQFSFNQRIEDVRMFAGQTVTLSFYAKLGTAQNAVNGLQLQQNFGSGGSATVNTSFVVPTLSTSWERYSFTVAVPSISGKTIGTSSYLNLVMTCTALVSQTVDIWGVQLEAGSVATPFQTATGTIQGELSACQRYYQRFTGTAYGTYALAYATSTTNAYVVMPFQTQMRTAPTVLDYSGLAIDFSGVSASAVSVLAGSQSSSAAYGMNATTTGLTQFRTYDLCNNNSTSGYIGFGAEL